MDGFINKVVLLYCFHINIIFSCAYKVDVIPSSGVILERLQDVYFTSSSWTFVLNYEMDQFREETKRVRELAGKLESIKTPPCLLLTYPRFQQEIEKVKSSMKSYLKDAEDLLHYLPEKTTGNCRGTFNIVGSMCKSLFGSIVEHEVSEIQSQIDKIKKDCEGTRHLLDKHLTLIAHMEKRIEANSQYLREITNTFLTLMWTFQSELSPKNYNFSRHTYNNFMHSLVASQCRELKLKISEAKFYLVNLKAAIHSSIVGTLNPSLIEPEKLEEMLKSIDTNESIPVTFPNIQTLQRYSLASVSAATSPSAFIFLISLPMFTPDSSFDAYLPHTYPVYNKDLEAWLELDLERSVLLISHDDIYFNVMPLSDYRSCIHDIMTICFKTYKVRSRNMPHCLLNIYNNSTDLCSYVLREPTVKPFIKRIQDSVIFSTDYKVVLNALCPNMKLRTLEVEGHGIIRNISYCTVTSGYEKISPLFIDKIGNTTLSLKLDIPSLDWSLPAITNLSEVLTADLDATKDAIFSLRNDISRDNGEVKLSSLVAYISETKQTRSQHFIFVTSLILSIIVAILLIFIICCVCRVRRKYQKAKEFI